MFLFKRNTKSKEYEKYSFYTDAITEATERPIMDIFREMSVLDVEYGLDPEEYLSKKYFELAPEDQIKKANQKRVTKRNLARASKETGMTETEIRGIMKRVKSQENITSNQFFKQKLYLSQEQLDSEAELKSAEIRERKKWVDKISEEKNLPREEVLANVKRITSTFDVTPKEYYSDDMCYMSDTQIARKHMKTIGNTQRRTAMFDRILSETGKDRSQVLQEIKHIKSENENLDFTLYTYYDNDFHRVDFSDADAVRNRVEDMIRLGELKNSLHIKLNQIDDGTLGYSAISDEWNSYCQITDKCLSPERREQLRELIRYTVPEVESDLDVCRKVTSDMQATQKVLNFSPAEYVVLAFPTKTIEERRTFVSNKLKSAVFNAINKQDVIDLFDNKYLSYEKLSEYYGRDILPVNKNTTYEDFASFCKNNDKFIKKRIFDSMGRGVEMVHTEELMPLKNAYADILEVEKNVIFEELIVAHKDIRKLNPDSVNTVRITVLTRDGVPEIQDCFMKIGRAGSIVDNGGAGGILVHVNSANGVFDSTGIDERGLRYEKHPDHGYKIKGQKLPKWSKALEIAKAASVKVGGNSYIGWDFTCDEKGNWIIVEGNSRTQFIGQQATIEKGIRKEFLEKTNAKAFLDGNLF